MMSIDKKTILLVEDEAVTLKLTSNTLKKFGYNVVTADTGETAVEITAGNKSINLILMDIDLGTGIDGTEAAALILKDRDIPIVFLSSHTEPEIVEKTEKITSYGYVVKNSGNTVLDACIKMAFKLFETKDKLKAIKDKMEATLNALPDLLFEVGLDGICYDYHSPRTELLYMPADELIGKKVYDFISSDIADIVMSAVKEADEKGFSTGVQYELNVPAGKLWFEISVARKDGSLLNPRFIVLSRDITKRKKALEAHRESEEKHKSILKAAMDGFWLTDLQGNIQEVNESYCKMSGYSEKELLGMTISEIEFNESKAEIADHMKKVIKLGGDRFNTLHRRKDGSIFEVEVSVNSRLNDDRQVVVFLRDITVQKRNEEAIRNSEEKYRNLVDNISDLIYEINSSGVLIYASPSVEKITGYNPDDVIGKNFIEFVYKDDRSLIISRFSDLKNGIELPMEYRFVKKTGEVIWVRTRTSPVYKDGIFAGANGLLIDITERKVTNEKLFESEKKYRTIFENAPIGIFRSTPEGRFIEVNPALADMLGYESPEEVLQKIYSISEQIYVRSEERQPIVDDQLKTSGITKHFNFYRRTDGTEFPAILYLNTIKSVSGKPLYLEGIVEDISEQKKADEMLLKSEKTFRLLYESMMDAYVSVDNNGIIQLSNKSFNDMLGYTQDELRQLSYKDITPEKYHEFELKIISEQIMVRGYSDLYEKEYRRKDGTLIPVELRTVLQKDENNHVVGMWAIVRNISERKLSDEKLFQSETGFRTVFEKSPVGLVLAGLDKVITGCNSAFCNFTGYSDDEISGKTISDITYPEDAEIGMKEMKQIINNEIEFSTLQKRYLRKDGKIVWGEITIRLIRDTGGNPLYFLSAIIDINERKRVEDDLLKSKNQLKIITDNIPAIINYVRSQDLTYIYVNQVYADAFDMTPEQMIGRQVKEILGDEAFSRALPYIKRAQSGERINYENIIPIHGESHFFDIDYIPELDSAGKVRNLFIMAVDITERKQFEEEHKKIQERYKAALDNSADILYEVDLQGKFTYFNDLSPEYFGYTANDIINTDFRNYMDEINTEKVYQTFHNVFVTGNPVSSLEWELIDINRKIFAVEASVDLIKDKNGKPAGFRGVLRDITKRKQIENALKESEEKFRKLIDISPVPMAINDEHGKITLLNSAFIQTYGYTLDDIPTLISWWSKAYPDPEYQKWVSESWKTELDKVNRTGDAFSPIEVTLKCKDGTTKTVLASASYYYRASENNHLVVLYDITERKMVEEINKSLLAEKDLILREVHHRIKNNMNVVYGLLVLQADSIKDPAAVNALEDAGNRIQSMMVLYDKLYRSPDVQNISAKDYLPSLVDEIISNFPNSKSVIVEKNIDDFILNAKKLQPLGIIINELLSNIMKYAFTDRDGGLITVGAFLTESDSAWPAFNPASRIKIIIQDNGSGLPESVDFENSTGFGLQLVSMLTKELNGTIRIERGNGTKIILEFEI